MNELDFSGLLAVDCGYVTDMTLMNNGSSLVKIAQQLDARSAGILCAFDRVWTRKLRTADNLHIMFEGTIHRTMQVGGTLILENCRVIRAGLP